MSPYLENMMQDCRRQLDNLRNQLGIEKYQHVEKLRLLKLEQKKIETRMKENRRKAQTEKDPAKRAALLLLIEEDGKKLEENLKEQQSIPKSGINFDPSKHVDKMMEEIRKALASKGGSSGGNPNRPKKPNTPNSPFGDDDKENDNNT